jgi:hypothetical protein
MRSFGIALFASAVSLLAGAPARDVAAPQAQAAMARAPLHFEANQGQWNPAVRYTAHARQYTVLLTATGPALAFGGGRRVDLTLDGSNRAPEIEALDRTAVATSYFVGPKERWRTGVPNYSRVRYRDVYPGIDVVYYGEDSRLEYDFLIEPGADPAAVRMRFQGADRASVTPRRPGCGMRRRPTGPKAAVPLPARPGRRNPPPDRWALRATGGWRGGAVG